jgi:hypothetical protein
VTRFSPCLFLLGGGSGGPESNRCEMLIGTASCSASLKDSESSSSSSAFSRSSTAAFPPLVLCAGSLGVSGGTMRAF